MRSFNRKWTLELQTNADEFRKAFRALVPQFRNRLIKLGFTWKFRVGEDYFGTIRETTFDLARRDDFQRRGLTVFGKMEPTSNSLKLELRIVNISGAKYAGVFFQSIFAAFIFGLFLNSIIRLFFEDPYVEFPFWLLITEWVILTVPMFFLIAKLHHYYLDLRIADFNRVFRMIEKAAKTE